MNKQNEAVEFDVLEYMRSISPVDRQHSPITTLEEWMRYWLQHYCGNLKESTFSSYTSATTLHINRVLGCIRLEDLNGEDIQLFINSLQLGVGIEAPLSPKSVKNIHGVLHKSLEVAVLFDYIETNPAAITILPKCEKPDFHPFTAKQLCDFLQKTRNHPKSIIFTVAAFTGMRQGELIGLTRDCIDFDDGSIRVYRQLVRDKINKQYAFSSVKNSKPRLLFPAPAIIKLLFEHKQKTAYLHSDFVFTSPNGTHYSHAAVYNSFKKQARKYGYPQMRFHDLRHTFAVFSLQAGDDVKTLQHNLGHHSAAFTLDVYGHCCDEMKRISARKMQSFLEAKFSPVLSDEEVDTYINDV